MKADLPNKVQRVLCRCLIVGSCLIGLLFLAIQIRLINVDALRDYGEGHTMWMSREINNLALSYKPLDNLPYTIFPYPPLYLLVSKAAGYGIGNLLTAGRIVSLASTVALAMIIAWLVFQSISASFPRLWRLGVAALGAALVLSTQSVVGWAGLMRVDMLGLMLMYGGLAIYITAGKRESRQFLAVFLFVLAAFTKQTLLSAPIACAIFGLFAYPKTTLRVFGAGLLLGLVLLAICHWLTEGGFLKNVVSYNLNPFSSAVVFAQFSSHLRLNMTLKLILSIAALAALWHKKGIRLMGWRRYITINSGRVYSRAILIGSLNACFACLLAVSIGKMGSIYNFFLAWDVSLCLLSVFYLFRLLATWRIGYKKTSTAPWALMLLLILLFVPSRWVVATVTEDFNSQVQEEAELVALVRETPGPVLSDNMLVVSKAGRPIQAEPATLSFLTRAGGWDEQPYLRLFNQQYFRLIIANPLESADRYSPAIVLAIEKNYEVERQIGGYLIYRPRTAARRF